MKLTAILIGLLVSLICLCVLRSLEADRFAVVEVSKAPSAPTPEVITRGYAL
jgi:hypothetical protein